MWENQSADITETEAPPPRWRQLIVPIGVSLLIHSSLLLIMRQSLVGSDTEPSDIAIPAPSIQITFRSPPVPDAAPEPPATEPLPEADTPEPLVTSEQVQQDISAPSEALPVAVTPPAEILPVVVTPPPEALPDASESQAPRLIAPSLLDLRDRIRNQAQSDSTGRIFSNADCDERQRRNDLIDCGDEDPNNRYGFDEAEQNDTTAFFAGLEAPSGVDSNAPRDATNPDTRAAVARDNLTGNLGAGPLIRSVMGQP
jgi:hypothetical protein